MSEPIVTAPPNAEQRLPVSGVTLLILAVAPSALLLLLLLHCLLLGYRLLVLAKRRRKCEHSRSPSPRRSAVCSVNANRQFFSSAPELGPPVTSSWLGSTAERRVRLLRPDGATRYTGSGSLRSWQRGSAPVLLVQQSSDSEPERGNVVPPNSPEQHVTPSGRASVPVRIMRRNSTMNLELISLDKVHVEGEVISSIPHETSCFLASTSSLADGPGLDSDFGASAADSDGFPPAAWASGLEWDYYDPSYVTQNHVPKHRHHAPPITIKQYWV